MVLKRWMSWILVLALLLPGVEAVNAMTAARPAPQAAACLSVAFLADVTIPDYSAMEAGKSFVKTWRVRNDGSCAWPEGAKLIFSDGDKLGAPASVAVGALAVGEKTDISITLKAPTANGTYQGAWRLSDDKGAAFGPRLTTLIKVGAGRTPAATATPKSASGTATPTSAACLNAGYLADVTIPDYSAVEAGKGFTKTWRVRNNGSCAWPADTQLTFVSGEQLGAAAKVTVGAVDAGVTKEISVEMKAPTANGSYKGVWQLASGAVFGTKLTVVIKVGAGSSAPATTGATPSTGASTPSAACLNASYVADVTIPDYTTFEPGKEFVKTWRLRNSGSCDWPADAQLLFSSGEALGAPANIAVGAVAPGATADISVNMKAPASNGTFKGIWSMASGAGAAYGGKITVIVRVGTAAAAPAPVAPVTVRPGGRGGFELGGHIRTWGYIPQMQHAGMSWAKIQVQYGQGATEMINMAHANGFKIQLSALGSPGMVTDADFHAKYSAWVAGLAASGADAIEVWNEPNIDREWQIGQIDPAAYTRLLCAAYGAIKAANPGTAVISAAPAPTGYFGGCGPNGCDDLPFIQGMYNAGAANCMDYIGAHHNSGATSPSARSGHPADDGNHHHSWYFLPQTELYYRTFRGARQLFYTEMGYASQDSVPGFSDQFWWGRGTGTVQQATWLAEAVSLSRSTGMVRCIIVWNIDFVRYGYDPQDGYAIIRPDGGCPACDSLRAAMQ